MPARLRRLAGPALLGLLSSLGSVAQTPAAPSAPTAATELGRYYDKSSSLADVRAGLQRGELGALLRAQVNSLRRQLSEAERLQSMKSLAEHPQGPWAESNFWSIRMLMRDGKPPTEPGERWLWRHSLALLVDDAQAWATERFAGKSMEASRDLNAMRNIACDMAQQEQALLLPERGAVAAPDPASPAADEDPLKPRVHARLLSGLVKCAPLPGNPAKDRVAYADVAARAGEQDGASLAARSQALSLLLFARTGMVETTAMRQRINALQTGMTAAQLALAQGRAKTWQQQARTSAEAAASDERAVDAAAKAAGPGPAETPAGWPDCQAAIAVPARAANQPVDDFDGLRPGMTLDAALAHAACGERRKEPEARAAARFRSRVNRLQLDGVFLAESGYMGRQVRTHTALVIGRTAPPRARMGFDYGRDLFEGMEDLLTEARVQWSFASFGDQGREQVLAFTRAENFPQDRSPLISAMVDAVQQKWGAPHWRDEGIGAVDYRWAFDLQGNPLPLTPQRRVRCEAPQYHTQHTDYLSDYELAKKKGCGLTLAVRISKHADQQRAHSFYFGLRDNRQAGVEQWSNLLDIWRHGRGEGLRQAAPPPKF